MTTDQAIKLQEELRQKLVLTWDGRPVKLIGGVDVALSHDKACAAIAIFHYPVLSSCETSLSHAQISFPYIPGLLAFHVGPAIRSAWQKLAIKPNLLLIHGHGIAHPRGLGLASQMGLWLEIPTIGVAKSLLYGTPTAVEIEPDTWRGLIDEANPDQLIGAVVRTRRNTRPVYVSPGHLIDLHNSIDFVLACCRGFRLPEPIRAAHQAAANFIAVQKADQ